MSAAAEPVPIESAKKSPAKGGVKAPNSTSEAISSLTPELVIALCGPIGSPLHEVGDQFKSALRKYEYRTECIRLSKAISDNAVAGEVSNNLSRYDEIKAMIVAGDRLRLDHGNDVLAKIAIAKISADREAVYGPENDAGPDEGSYASQRVCHVIDSIKNKSELELLRLIYGEALIAVGVFSPVEVRISNLQRSSEGVMTLDEVKDLIDIDSGEEFSHGQSVRDTFPRCDFFLRVDDSISGASEDDATGQIASKVSRLLGLVFRTAVTTPTPEEAAMYASASAARNSACLSRQVGAAVTSSGGELLAVGWNDVPQPGGGLYGKPPVNVIYSGRVVGDQRCFSQTGMKCHNDEEKKKIANLLADLLAKEGVVAEDKKGLAAEAIAKSRVKDLIEFSRAVHAEMHAILTAGRVAGEKIVGGKIFVTTYPCHACARHIVAAGISEIHYIEPYRKSLATKLHDDALTEAARDAQSKVVLLQFDGVAPRRFIDFFEAGDRKSGGVLKLPGKDAAKPAAQVSMRAIPKLEEVVVAELATKNFNLPSLSKSTVRGQANVGEE
jgi:deoxycytidylate deaminase